MKKNNLFKAVGIVILVYVLLSWLVPIVYSIGGWKGEVSNQIGFVSFINVILETCSGFGSVVVYVLLVGAFYGVLRATGAYDKVMDRLTTKASGREKATLITIIVCMALLSSVAGLDLGLLFLFPLLIGLIVNMGYDKLVALSATVGATMIGIYGATFAGTLYGTNKTILGLGKFDQIWPKVILFVLGLGSLITFVLLYIKNNNVKKTDVRKTDVKKVEAKLKKTVKNGGKKVSKERGALPALIILGIVLLVIFLGTTSWGDIFKSNWFEKAHTSWTEFTIAKFAILNKLFGGVDAFGTWNAPARYQTYSLLLVFAMIALKFVYKTKWDDVFEGFIEGIKSFIIPALLTVLACSVFVLVYYNPFLSVVTGALLSVTKNFNVALAGLYTIIHSIFYVDYYYLAYASLYNLTTVYSDKSVLSVLSIMYTNLYGLVMLVAPTSVLLLISLSISDVKYTDWLKFIWKLVVVLFIISFITFTVVATM